MGPRHSCSHTPESHSPEGGGREGGRKRGGGEGEGGREGEREEETGREGEREGGEEGGREREGGRGRGRKREGGRERGRERGRGRKREAVTLSIHQRERGSKGEGVLTHSRSDPDPLLHFSCGGHGVHATSRSTLLRQIVHSLTHLDDAEVPLCILPRPRPQLVALLHIVHKYRTGIDCVDLLQGMILGLCEGVLSAEEAGLADSLHDLRGWGGSER